MSRITDELAAIAWYLTNKAKDAHQRATVAGGGVFGNDPYSAGYADALYDAAEWIQKNRHR